MIKAEKNRQRVLNGGRGGGQAYRRLFEYYENKVYALNERIAELEKQIEEMMLDVKEMAKQADKNVDMLALKKMLKLFNKWEQKLK